MEQSNLPYSPGVPVQFLAASFNHVTNSYKFYWLLAILDHIKETQSPIININSLIARMVGNAWYPTNYFRLSFGKQDRLSQIALAIKSETDLPVDANKRDVIATALAYTNERSQASSAIKSLERYVPYRFLQPFFSTQLQGIKDDQKSKITQQLAEQSFSDLHSPCLYKFVHLKTGMAIEINPLWFAYLQAHLSIVTGFCLWHLLNYLQKNNPNVPNIAGKLFEPGQRKLSSCREFWQEAFRRLGTITCIYSGMIMDGSDFSLDHFLPWSFVTHDLLWNIIPTPKVVNSAKSDRLPAFDRYFGSFAQLQYVAVQRVVKNKKAKLIEDYILLCKKQSAAELQVMPFTDFRSILQDTIAPQIQIARNMGFASNWSYVST